MLNKISTLICFVLSTVTSHYYSSSFDPLQLPEVIDNRAKIPSGYNYPIPQIPFDETPIVTPIFSPTNDITIRPLQDSFPVIRTTYFPPIPYDEVPVYAAVPPDASPNSYLPPTPNTRKFPKTFLKILNMTCLNSPLSKFFRARIQTDPSFNSTPIIEDSIGDCISGGGDTFHLEFVDAKMVKCGVRSCRDQSLCLKLRIPVVNGLKLPEDVSVVLLCKPQDVVASHVRNLKLHPRFVQGRLQSTVASGGSQRMFESDVSLYRRAPGGGEFTQIVSPGSSVLLGEDLLLRAAVRDGDGWKYSRMGAVVMQREVTIKSHQATGNSITLVDENGCRVPAMNKICPEQPRQSNPLVTTFPFRAFMFQGSNGNEEMVLSVRIHACLHYADCSKVRACEEKVKREIRRKRGIENGTRRRDNITDWHSYLEFRVVLPESRTGVADGEGQTLGKVGPLANPFMVACIASTVALVLVLTVISLRRQFRNVR